MHKKPAEKKKKFFRFSLMHFFMQKWEFLGALRRTRVQILPPTTTKRKFCGSRFLGGRETNLGGGPSLRQAMVPGKRGKICEKEDPKMKKRTLSILLSLCLAVTLVTPAVAAEENGTLPEVTDMSIVYNGDDATITKTESNGSFLFTAPGGTKVVDYTTTVTLSSDAVFTATTPGEGDLYVSAVGDNTVTLKFNLTVGDVNINTDQFALTLEKQGNNIWTGGFSNAADLTLETLAGYLTDQNIQLAAGALGANSPAQDILVNMDDENVMLVLCAPGVAVYTVDYVVDESTTITWKLPAGAEIPAIAVETSGSQEFKGWYTDSALNNALASGTTVTGNTTLYAKITGGAASSGNFYDDLTHGRTATIEDQADWETFVENADKAVAGQLVILGENINCNGATYDSLTFKGNFNGNGKTISNATFRAVDSAYYTSSENDIVCSGMFAALGAGQIVANLTLANVTAEYASTYSAVLAGLADGTSANPVLIQNVQVRGGSASGRTAAGVVGFTRNTTVKYCSSIGTTITGLANGGGIVGINNAKAEFCYSTTSPTALPSFLGGSTGGVVSKKVRGGWAEFCWSTMTVVGESDSGGTDKNLLVVDATTSVDMYEANGFTQDCWNLATGPATTFNASEVNYTFSENNTQ